MNDHTTHGRLRRAIATAGAAALTLMGALAVAAPASAADVPNLPDGPYTLNITKLAQPDTGVSLPNDGNSVDVSGMDPLEGVTFEVAPVQGIDLSTADGWHLTEDLSVDGDGVVTDGTGHTYAVGSGTTQTTDGSGLAPFTELPLGVYRITETDQGSNQITGSTAPFLVTLPYPHENSWLSTLWVYPKNALLGSPTKTVDDSAGYGLGSTVTWTINAPVPSLTAGQSMDTFIVEDQLDEALSIDSADDVTVTLADSGGTDVPLDAGDYTVAVTNPVTVTFTETGRAKLAANGGGEVTVAIDTTVIGVGSIENSATLTVNDNDPLSALPAQTTWGSLNILKVQEGTTNLMLEGAEFQVFTSEADARALTNPVAVNGETTFVTGENGTVTIAGLRSQNNGTGDNLTYYLVETKAPVGYNIATDFSQGEGGQPVTIFPGESDNEPVVVEDPKVPGFELPITGGGGTAAFIGGGLALVALGLGGGLYAHSRKRRAARR